ncbi:PilZ domain-containing protein [Desulfobotulus alkaliphilus]|uniref:PilZ domain-containing protein n=1 Tax=Desulfobotulus alkaliphilus TaxID=622671 RepID=A0A562RGH9_9BACT|nr:PilZ domain-containing protein [Desulfobotulus alkaliphilus]TWI68209.1 PilZ domain-containing protein [Desulfobotulus alkaliphilus]
MDDFKEKRKDVRQNYFSPVVYTTQDQEYREYILDISGGGVFIKTRNILPPDTEVNLFLPFPGGNYISLLGVVVRSGEKGIAVQFHNEDLELIHSLQAMVESIRLLEG